MLLFSIFNFQFSLFAQGGGTVALSPWWLATVDDDSQRILLRWAPSPDSATMGYHICSGSPCDDYAVVYGRLDTTYWCNEHSPLEEHTYRLHVFENDSNVSSLRDVFGNMVLQADISPCGTSVSINWTPYRGMPVGVARYNVLAKLEPFHSDFVSFHTVPAAGPYNYSFEIPENTVRVAVKVEAVSGTDSVVTTPLVAQSNRVELLRQTADTALFFEITRVEYDSINKRILLFFCYDTTFHISHYTLWRSVDGSPWAEVADIPTPDTTYVETDYSPYDSLHCYQLSVTDACGLNDRYSETRCVVTPDPPKPTIAIPNVLKVGDSVNGLFCPVIRGLKGNLYELTIYNRLGLQIFYTTNPADCWDPASYSPEISQGSYTYYLRCRFNNNRIHTYSGTILVLK